jgi:hypothetical protein
MLRALVAIGCVLLFVSCTKKPTPAQLALEAYADKLAHRATVTDSLIDGAEVSYTTTGGEPQEGTAEAFSNNIGAYDWSRTKLVKEEKLPSGDERLELTLDLCLRQEDNGQCTRPNTYLFKALVRNVGGAWKVAGVTCSESNSVR